MNRCTFDNYTKLGTIIKEINLGLNPVGATRDTIARINTDEYDATIQGLIDDTAPFIDAIIRAVMDRTLKTSKFDFEALSQLEEKDLITEISKITGGNIPSNLAEITGYSTAQKLASAAFLKDIPNILAGLGYEKEAEQSREIMPATKGRASAFTQFMTTRITALMVLMPKRIAENFSIYKSNIEIMKTILDSDIAESVKELYPETESFTETGMYANFLTQEGIDSYNRVLDGLHSEDKTEKKGIKNLIQEYNNSKPKKELPAPKALYKQILSNEGKDFGFVAIKNDEALIELLKTAGATATYGAKRLMEEIQKVTAEDVVVRYKNVHGISHMVYGDHNRIPDVIKAAEAKEFEKAYEEAGTKKEREKAERSLDNIQNAIKNNEYTMSEIEDYMGDNGIFEKYRNQLQISCRYAIAMSEDFEKLSGDIGKIRNNEANTGTVISLCNAWTEARNMVRYISRKDIGKGNAGFYNTYAEHYRDMRAMDKAERKATAYITAKPANIADKRKTLFGSCSRISPKWLNTDGVMSIIHHTIIKKDNAYYYFLLTPGAKKVNMLKDTGDAEVFIQKTAQDAAKWFPAQTFTQARAYFRKHPAASEYALDNTSKPMSISRELYDIYESGAYKGKSCQEKGSASDTYLLPGFCSVLYPVQRV